MNVQNRKNKDGFTIIEVVLVLAIAALIFLMVFIALPALQRNQRDTQRKSDAGRVASQIAQWQSSHRGAVPTAAQFTANFIPQYMQSGGGQFNDPNGNDYTVITTNTAITANLASNATTGATLRYFPSSQCNADPGAAAATSTARKFSVTVQLESGVAYCVDNV